jgi:hypothetical protein
VQGTTQTPADRFEQLAEELHDLVLLVVTVLIDPVDVQQLVRPDATRGGSPGPTGILKRVAIPCRRPRPERHASSQTR